MVQMQFKDPDIMNDEVLKYNYIKFIKEYAYKRNISSPIPNLIIEFIDEEICNFNDYDELVNYSILKHILSKGNNNNEDLKIKFSDIVKDCEMSDIYGNYIFLLNSLSKQKTVSFAITDKTVYTQMFFKLEYKEFFKEEEINNLYITIRSLVVLRTITRINEV